MSAKLEWVTCGYGQVPENPVIAGADKGRVLYVIRVQTEPGREQWRERGIPDDGLTSGPTFMWNEELSSLKEYEVLTVPDSSRYYWGPRSTSHAPFTGGFDNNGPLYIARKWEQGRYFCGFGSDHWYVKEMMQCSHQGQIELKDDFDVLNPIPSSMLKGRDDEKSDCCYVFGWTPFHHRFNIQEEFLACVSRSNSERRLITKVVHADGELTFDHALLMMMDGNKDVAVAESTAPHGFHQPLQDDDQLMEVLLACPGAYCWGVPRSSGEDELARFGYPIGRVLYNGSYHVGHVRKDSCDIRNLGGTIIYDRLIVATPENMTGDIYLPLGVLREHVASGAGLGTSSARRSRPHYGFLVNSEQELVSVTRSWTHAGHRIQGKGSREPDSTEPSYDESMFEVLLGWSEHLQWVRDGKGYVPPGAVIGGISSDGGYVYVGRVDINGAGYLGTILPSQKICTVTGTDDGDTRDFDSYEVLVNTRTENVVTPAPSKDMDVFVKKLKDLQRGCFLKNWHNEFLRVVNEDSERRVHDHFLTFVSASNAELFHGDDDEPDWISYVGRLARMYQFPPAFQTFLFKLIEFHGLDNLSQRATQRLASILKYGAKAGRKLVTGCENASCFGPVLSHLAQDSCRLDEISITEILQTVLITLERQKSRVEDLLRTRIIPSGWAPLLEACLLKVNPLQRPELIRRFKAQGILAAPQTHLPDRSSSQSADQKAIAKLKLKSLSSPGNLELTAHFVHVQQLQVMNFQTESLSDMPAIPGFDYIRNFDEYVAVTRDKGTPTVGMEMDQAFKRALSESATPEEFNAVTRGLFASELPLDSDKLRVLIAKGNGSTNEDQRVAITWTLLASISNYKNGTEKLQEEVQSELVRFLIQVAQACSSQVTGEAIFATLFTYCLSWNYSEEFFNALKQLLTSTIFSPNTEKFLQRILQFLCSLLHPAAFDAAMIKEVWDVLERSDKHAIRILCTRHISIAVSEHEQPLGNQVLEALAQLTEDNVRDVRVHSSVAFANGLLNNPNLHSDKRMIELVAKVFAIHPVQLTIPGCLPQDYTHIINGPLLLVIGKLSKIPRALVNRFCKFLGNLASSQTQPTKYLRAMVQQIVKLLVKGLIKILPGTVESVEKLFLADNNASKGEDYGSCLLEFLSKCVELKLIRWNYTASEKLLQKIAAKMKLEMSPIYAILLHMFTTIQELPERIFRMYHLQMIALGLSSTDNPENPGPLRRFLSDHALLPDIKDGSELLRAVQEHLKRGARPSSLTIQILINSLDSTESAEDSVEVLEELVGSGNGCLTESQMKAVCSVKLDPYGRRVWDSLLHSRLLQNQQLSRALVQQMLDDVESRPAGGDSSSEVLRSLVLENPVASSSLQIVQQVLRIALMRINVPTALKPGMNQFQKEKIKMREESTTRSALSLLFQALKSIQRMNQHLCPELAEKVKVVILSPKKCYLQDTPITDTDLLLQLHAVSSLRLGISQVCQILDSDGPTCIFRKSKETLQLLYSMLLSQINDIERNQPAHVLVNILGVLLGSTEDILIASACGYIENEAYRSFFLPLHFLAKLEIILRSQQSGAYSKQIIQAIQNAASGPRHQDLRHLEDFSKAAFSSWLNARTLSAKHGNALILLCLYKHNGWQIDAKTREILDLIMFVEGSCQLEPAKPPLTAPPASSAFTAKTKAEENATVVPFEKITRAMAQLFIERDVDDLQMQALILGRAVEIFKHLQRRDKCDLWDDLVRLVRTQNTASQSMTALLTQTPLHSLFETLNDFLAQPTPITFRHCLSSNPQEEEILQHALIWKIASIVHNKVKTKSEFNRSPSIVLSSELFVAIGGRAEDIMKLLKPIAHIENHEELEMLISMLTDCNQETAQTFPDWYSSEYEHLLTDADRKMTVEKIKIKLTLGYVMARFPTTSFGTQDLTRIALDLYELLKLGVCSYKHLLKLGSKSTDFSYQDLARLFRMLRDYNVKGLTDDAYEELLRTMDSGQDERFHMLPMVLKSEKSQEDHEGSEKSVGEFVKALRQQNPCLANIDPKVLLDVLENAQTNISSMEASDIQAWSATVRKGRRTKIDPLKFISVVQRAFELLRGWTLTTVQIFSIYVAIADDGQCRLFQQVSTGLGKSLIIAVVAVKKALEGRLVDIYTSNSQLASRDSNEWSDFFAIFGLTCDHNGEEEGRPAYVDGKKACYDKHIDIVYGDIRQFEFDALRSDYLSLKTRGVRAYGFAIVDEVDSCYIDDAAKLTILSAPIAGMELLQPLYHMVWKFMLEIDAATSILQIDSAFFAFEGKFVHQSGRRFYISPRSSQAIIDDDIQAAVPDGDLARLASWKIHKRRSYIKTRLESYIKNLITGRSDDIKQPEFDDLPAERIKIPMNMKEFVSCQAVHLAEAAIVAHTLRELKDYVTVNGLIAPIDPSNGATQHRSSWSNGVQQFLQVKHSLHFTPQTLMTAFMSHRSMLEKYNDGLFGITGTLGNAATSEFLKALQIKTVQIPDPYSSNRLRVFPAVQLAADKSGWMLKIKEATEKELKGERAVLIICSTIRCANKLREYLVSRISEHNGVHLYARSDSSEETSDEDFRHIRAESRSIYITTLLGARGMDIRPIGEDDCGGIHVILTFLLPNGRVEKQAFGRAARQGSFGSVQYILKAPEGSADRPTTSASISTQMNAAEDEQLGLLQSQVYPAICAKDDAFEEYRKCFTFMHNGFLSTDQESGILTKAKEKVLGTALTELDLSLLAAYQEYWALHLALKSSLVQLSQASKDSMDKIKMALKDFKRPTIEENPANNHFNYRNPEKVFELTRSSFHPTRYGFQLYADNKTLPFFETIPDAKRYFQLALTYDPEFAAGASLGLAYISLLGDKKYYVTPKNAPGYKDEAITNLTRCLAIFSQEVCQFQSLLNRTEHEGNGDDPLPSEYERQLRARLQVLQHYGAVVYKTLDFVRLSFRKVYLLQSSPQLREETKIQIPLSCTQLSLSILEKTGRVTLECEGLGWKKDLNSYHQAKSTIEFLTKEIDSRVKRGGEQEQTESCITKMRLEAENVPKFFEYLSQDTTTPKNVPGLLKVFKDGSIILDIEFKAADWEISNALDLCKTISTQDFYSVRLTRFPEDFAKPMETAFKAEGGEGIQLWNCRHQQCKSEGCKLELELDSEDQEVRGRIKYGTLMTLLKEIAAIVPNANVVVEEIQMPASHRNQGSLFKGAQQVWIHVPIAGALNLLEELKKIDINPHSVQFTNLPIAIVQGTIKQLNVGEDPITQVAFKPLTSLFFNFQSPTDVIQEMKMRGLHWVAAFEELDSPRRLTNALLVVQFCVEVAAGVLLTSTGIGGIFAQPLYAAAMYDISALAKHLFSRQFSWTAYCLAKPLALAFSFGLTAALPGDATPGKTFFDRVLETFASYKLFQAASESLLLDGLSSFVALLAGPLADYIYKQERSMISKQVHEVVAKYLEEKPEMKAQLASFCALERLEHGNVLSSISSASQLQFRLWLKSAGLGVPRSWRSKLLRTAELWLIKQGIRNLGTFKELTVAGILLHSARLIRGYEGLETVTYDACAVIQERLRRRLSIMQDLSSVLVSHCGLSHEQVHKLRIKQGISCFSGDLHLPEDAGGLDFVTDQQLFHARQRLAMLRELKSSLAPIDQSILLASLSDFVTDHVVGYAAKAIIASAMTAPSRQGPNSAQEGAAQGPHCVVITSQHASCPPSSAVVSTCADESQRESEGFLTELINFCMDGVGPFNSTLQSSVRQRPAAIHLAKAIFYCFFTGRKISVVEDSSDSCSTPIESFSSTPNSPVLLFQLNEERTEVVCARLEGDEKRIGNDCLLHALGKRSGSVIIGNYFLAFYRLSWLIDHLIAFSPLLSKSNTLHPSV